MRYIKFTYVDAVTGAPVSEAPALNGPVFPAVAGLEFGWARESQYPTAVPEFFGTCPDDSGIDVPGVFGEHTETDWIALLDDELKARQLRLNYARLCRKVCEPSKPWLYVKRCRAAANPWGLASSHCC